MKQPEKETLIRRKEVERRTGLSRSTLYALISSGDFPPPVRITARAVAWPESHVENWITQRVISATKSHDSSNHPRDIGRQSYTAPTAGKEGV